MSPAEYRKCDEIANKSGRWRLPDIIQIAHKVSKLDSAWWRRSDIKTIDELGAHWDRLVEGSEKDEGGAQLQRVR